MKRMIIVGLMLCGIVGLRADQWLMSSAAVDAFYTWHLKVPVPPRGITLPWNFGEGSRRFATQVVTWRALEPNSMQAINARKATRFWTEVIRLNSPGQVSEFRFVEVAPTDETAQLTFKRSATAPGMPYPYNQVGCAMQVPKMMPDGLTFGVGSLILSNPTRSGCDGDRLMMHEVAHYMVAITADLPSGILSDYFVGCPQWNRNLTPEQNAADPRWEGVAGTFEMAAWVIAHQPGAFPGTAIPF